MHRSHSALTPRLAVAIALLVLCALLFEGGVAGVGAQDSGAGESVRIIARTTADGRVEFGLRSEDGNQLPRLRMFPTETSSRNWKVSSVLELSDGAQVQIIARNAPRARLEFGLRIGQPPRNLLPPLRFFPRASRVGFWRVSSPLQLPARPAAQEPEPESNDPNVERIRGGHRDGLIVNRNVIGDPNAPALIVEYGDPL